MLIGIGRWPATRKTPQQGRAQAAVPGRWGRCRRTAGRDDPGVRAAGAPVDADSSTSGRCAPSPQTGGPVMSRSRGTQGAEYAGHGRHRPDQHHRVPTAPPTNPEGHPAVAHRHLIWHVEAWHPSRRAGGHQDARCQGARWRVAPARERHDEAGSRVALAGVARLMSHRQVCTMPPCHHATPPSPRRRTDTAIPPLPTHRHPAAASLPPPLLIFF